MQANTERAVPVRQQNVSLDKVCRRSVLPGPQADLEIVAAILKAASHNGGESIIALRKSTGISSGKMKGYVGLMLGRKLLSVEKSLGTNPIKVYRPTELGYEFLLRRKELIDLINSEDKDLFHFWD